MKSKHVLKIMTLCLVVLTSWVVGEASLAHAQSGTPASETPERPKWKFLRFQEDWSVMRLIPESQHTDVFDPIKYIPLNEAGTAWVSLGGRGRFRVENWNNFGFAPANGDTYLLTRAFLHSDIHVGPALRVFIEAKTANVMGRTLPGKNDRAIDADDLALQQAFLDIQIPIDSPAKFTLRVGRRELLKGKQRLVSPLPWGNTLRHWDGISGILDINGWNIEGFWTRFAPVKPYRFNDSPEGNTFFGVYGAGKVGSLALDVYWLGIDRNVRTFNGTTGKENRHTLGARVEGKVPSIPIDFELEGAYQVGTLGSADIRAFMIASQVGARWADGPWKPRIFVGFDYASGDHSPGGDVQTFNQLFPLGHAYLGFIDLVGRQNSVDFSHGVTVHPIKKMAFTVAGHKFWRADSNDALYNPGGGVVRTGAAGTSKDIGYEIDLLTKYVFTRHLTGVAGYSHLWAGNFIKQSGPSKDIDFAYVMGIFNF